GVLARSDQLDRFDYESANIDRHRGCRHLADFNRIRQTFETYSHPVRVGLQRSAVLRAHNLGKLPNRVIKDLQQIGKGQLSNAAGSVNRPISLKNSKNCRSKRLRSLRSFWRLSPCT